LPLKSMDDCSKKIHGWLIVCCYIGSIIVFSLSQKNKIKLLQDF
jgi:hypothetical protein